MSAMLCIISAQRNEDEKKALKKQPNEIPEKIRASWVRELFRVILEETNQPIWLLE